MFCSKANRVQTLNLQDNSDLQISETTFSNLPNLEELQLSNCGITQVFTEQIWKF